MIDDRKPAPAWGYHPVHGGKIFSDGNLPPDWAARPHPGQHPHDAVHRNDPAGRNDAAPGDDAEHRNDPAGRNDALRGAGAVTAIPDLAFDQRAGDSLNPPARRGSRARDRSA